jgi:predicted outer membrane repeat protein
VHSQQSVFSNNTAGNSGGALHLEGSIAASIKQNTFRSNAAKLQGGLGGGVALVGVIGPVTLTDCVLGGNRAIDSGGALYMHNCTAAYVNSTTFEANVALRGGAVDLSAPVSLQGNYPTPYAVFDSCSFLHNLAVEVASKDANGCACSADGDTGAQPLGGALNINGSASVLITTSNFSTPSNFTDAALGLALAATPRCNTESGAKQLPVSHSLYALPLGGPPICNRMYMAVQVSQAVGGCWYEPACARACVCYRSKLGFHDGLVKMVAPMGLHASCSHARLGY